MYLFDLELLSFPDIFPEVGLLGHKVVLFAIFSGVSTLVSTVAALACVPTSSAGGFPFPTYSPKLFICRLLDNGPSD